MTIEFQKYLARFARLAGAKRFPVRTLAALALVGCFVFAGVGCKKVDESVVGPEAQGPPPNKTSEARSQPATPFPGFPMLPQEVLELVGATTQPRFASSREDISITLDAQKLRQHQLDVEQVVQAIRTQTQERVLDGFEQIGELIVSIRNGQPVRLKDVATIRVQREPDLRVGDFIISFSRCVREAFIDICSPVPAPSKLDFRIAPNAPGATRDSAPGQAEVKRYVDDLTRNGPLAGRKRNDKCQWFELKADEQGLISGEYRDRKYVLLCARDPYVMLSDAKGSRAWGLTVTYRTTDHRGRPAVGLVFDDAGDRRFFVLTSANIGNRLAILVDGTVMTAPVIQSAISRQVFVSGEFTEQEARNLARALEIGMPPSAPRNKPPAGERQQDQQE